MFTATDRQHVEEFEAQARNQVIPDGVPRIGGA